MNLRTKPTWELRAIIKALSLIPFFNTDEDNKRLEQAQIVLYERRLKNSQPIKMEVKWLKLYILLYALD
mgnify:CR=1 FL=1